MKFREYIDMFCAVREERFSYECAKEFLVEISKSSSDFSTILEEYTSSKNQTQNDRISESVFASYLREGRNMSRELASEVKSSYSISKLKKYIRDQCTNSEKKQILCDQLKERTHDHPDINKKNAVNIAAEEFEKMLYEILHASSQNKSEKQNRAMFRKEGQAQEQIKEALLDLLQYDRDVIDKVCNLTKTEIEKQLQAPASPPKSQTGFLPTAAFPNSCGNSFLSARYYSLFQSNDADNEPGSFNPTPIDLHIKFSKS